MEQLAKYPRLGKQGKSYKLTSSEIKQIQLLSKQGWSRASIARKFDITPMTVLYHVSPTRKSIVIKTALELHAENKNKDYYQSRRRKWNKERRKAIEYKIYKSIATKLKHENISDISKLLDPEQIEIFKAFYKQVRPKLKSVRI